MFSSQSDYLKSIQTSGQSKEDQDKQMLAELTKQTKGVEKIAENTKEIGKLRAMRFRRAGG